MSFEPISERMLEEISNSTLTDETKHEFIEWLWANMKITDEQYRKYIPLKIGERI